MLLQRLQRRLHPLQRDDRGSAAIEYALIGAIIALGTIGGLKNTKAGLQKSFNRTSGNIMLATAHVDRCDNTANCFPTNNQNFSVGQINPASGPILTSGFSYLEQAHVWSVGNVSTMQIDLGSLVNQNKQSATLNLYTSSLIAQFGVDNVTTTVSVNGVPVGTIQYVKGETGAGKSLVLNNDAMIAIAANNGVANLTFDTDKVGRPVDYNYNSDARNLGIAISNLSVN